jgi:hypothetical protein
MSTVEPKDATIIGKIVEGASANNPFDYWPTMSILTGCTSANSLGVSYLYVSDRKRTEAHSLKHRFDKLTSEWRNLKGPISSDIHIAMLDPYQKIIALGKPVLPLIFEELKKQPDHWFWALEKLTGENPVPDEQRGYIRRMANIWLEWARKEGYLS